MHVSLLVLVPTPMWAIPGWLVVWRNRQVRKANGSTSFEDESLGMSW